MAHLKKLPTYFVKGDERRAAYYTIQARELRAAGRSALAVVAAVRGLPRCVVALEAPQHAF